MLNETIRLLRQLEERSQISVPTSDDEEGYFDRECPSEQCLFQFKIFREDWKDKVRDEEVFCPNCGHTAESNKWWTQEQIEHAKQAALGQVKSTISSALRRDAAAWNKRQPRDSFLSMTMRVDSLPRVVLLPAVAAESMRLKIVCPACACRYAVIGAAYFCPACGHNAAEQLFDQTVNGIRSSVGAVDAVRAAIPDRDTAENTVRLIVENSLQNVVTAFQRCAESIFAGLPSAPIARRNAFQNISEGDQLWQKATGGAYADHLKQEEIVALHRTFQQRHLLTHRQGLVDQDYITKSGDTRYKVDQRIVVRTDAVLDAATIVEKLVSGMMADVAKIPRPK